MSTFRTQKQQIRMRMRSRRSESKMPQAASKKVVMSAVDFITREHSKIPGVLFTYLTAPDEVDTTSSLSELFSRFERIAVPAVIGKSIEAIELFPNDPPIDGWQRAPSGVPIPPPELVNDARRKLDPQSIAVALVPGIAFDQRGYRIGFGSGHYDRFFDSAGGNLKRIGLAFDFQIVPDVPHEPHDVPMHAVVTETRIIQP